MAELYRIRPCPPTVTALLPEGEADYNEVAYSDSSVANLFLEPGQSRQSVIDRFRPPAMIQYHCGGYGHHTEMARQLRFSHGVDGEHLDIADGGQVLQYRCLLKAALGAMISCKIEKPLSLTVQPVQESHG